MITAVNVTAAATKVFAITSQGTDFRNGPRNLVLANTSDTTIYVAFGADNGALLTTANGIPLAAGLIFGGDNTLVPQDVYAIHGGSGNKVLRIQTF